MDKQTVTKGNKRILSLLRCENCMKNIASDEEVWKNSGGELTLKEIFCSQRCAIQHLKYKEGILNT